MSRSKPYSAKHSQCGLSTSRLTPVGEAWGKISLDMRLMRSYPASLPVWERACAEGAMRGARAAMSISAELPPPADQM